MILVAIAEDHSLMRESIKSFLLKMPGIGIAVEAENGIVLLEYFQKVKQPPVVVVVDVNMPVMDGAAVTYFLRQNYSSVKILALSYHDSGNTIKCMLEAGVHGYLLKQNLICLPKAISTILDGHQYFDKEIPSEKLSFSNDIYDEPTDDKCISFTAKEKLFLQLVTADISFEKIASLMNVAPSTLDNYQKTIKEKTGISTRNALAVYAIQHRLAKVASFYR